MPMDLPIRRRKSVLSSHNWYFLAGVFVGIAIGILI